MNVQVTKPILLLSGTPASGKDTVTSALIGLNNRFIHFKKHRGSQEPKEDNTYIHVDNKEFKSLIDQGAFIQHHGRYGRQYGVALSQLEGHWSAGQIPIVHVGKYENIAPFKDANIDVRSILLLVDKAETENRLKARHPGDEQEIQKRLAAYQEERDGLAERICSGVKLAFDLILDNSGHNPKQVAHQIEMFYRS